MKIIVATIGSRGDVQPYINLCQGLQAAGHQVTLATNPTLCGLADAHGIPSAAVGSPVDMGEVGARLMAESHDNMWLGLIKVMRVGAKLVEEAYPQVLALCRESELVITSDTGSGIAEAERLGKPWISVTLQPGRIPMDSRQAGVVSRAFGTLMGKLFILPTNRFRARVGAPPARDISDLLSKRMILLPVSDRVAPHDPRWPGYVQPTGYWFAREDPGWTPPADLVEFLTQGERPVAVSLGVMSGTGKRAEQGARIILQALRENKVRAVIQGWDERLRALETGGDIFYAGSLPHAWLFEQVSAVIHHGGFGTTAAVLRAGAPGIVIPHVIDQFYWGQQVRELGCGPQPIRAAS